MATRTVNQSGLALIKKSENDNDPKSGYRVDSNGNVYFVPYPCSAKIPTIGYGSICYEDGTRVTLKDKPINMERALELLHYEIKEKSAPIESFDKRHKLNLNDNQFSALVSLAYNCGAGAIINMDASMRAALLKKDRVAIAAAFRMWNKVTKEFMGIKRKVVEPGLVTRREREIELFFKA